MDLNKGLKRGCISDITMHLEPDSVILRDPADRHALQILEQDYRAEPISQGLLLNLYEGKEIEFVVGGPEERIVKGRCTKDLARTTRCLS